MANYFAIVSHYEEGKRDEFYKQVQRPDKLLSIGWGEVNPLNSTYKKVYEDIIKAYPDFQGTNNPDNGAKSLMHFSYLTPGDIIFVRGYAKILDVVIVTGNPFYDYNNGHEDGDYFLKVPFSPLFKNQLIIMETANIPQDIYNDVLRDGGRSIVVRPIPETSAKILLKSIFKFL